MPYGRTLVWKWCSSVRALSHSVLCMQFDHNGNHNGKRCNLPIIRAYIITCMLFCLLFSSSVSKALHERSRNQHTFHHINRTDITNSSLILSYLQYHITPYVQSIRVLSTRSPTQPQDYLTEIMQPRSELHSQCLRVLHKRI